MSATPPEDDFPADLGELADEELVALAPPLVAQEDELSSRRSILHGKIDILRTELVNRMRKRQDEV